MPETTVIRNASWVIAWDRGRDAHVYLEDVDVAFEGRHLVQIGGRWEGDARTELDGRERLVMPGLIDLHAHPADESLAKGVFDDVGSPSFYGNALYEFGALLDPPEGAELVCARHTLAELLASGVTTVVDLSAPYDGWLELLGESGLRAYAGPGFRDARWAGDSGYRLDYHWDRQAGRAAFDAALGIVDRACAHPSGRLSGLIAPAQADTCSEELLREAHGAARERAMPLTVHAGQLMMEFDEMLRRHGTTTVQWLDGIGLLDEHTTLGHGIFLDHHSWTRLRTAADLPTLAERGSSIAHCPVTFARSGMTLESLGRYQREGVNVAMGTDSYPTNMLEEMRQALYAARITSKDVHDVDVADVFNAATVAGARALGREDIGRLSPGCLADVVLVDLSAPSMRPVHDPLRSLVLSGADRAVRDVFIDGEAVVRDGEVITIDRARAAAELQVMQERSVHDARIGLRAPRAFPVLTARGGG